MNRRGFLSTAKAAVAALAALPLVGLAGKNFTGRTGMIDGARFVGVDPGAGDTTRVLVMGKDRLEAIDMPNPVDWDEARIYGLVRTQWYTRAEIEAMYGPGGVEFLASDPSYGLLTIDHELAEAQRQLGEAIKANNNAIEANHKQAASYAALAAGAMSAVHVQKALK